MRFFRDTKFVLDILEGQKRPGWGFNCRRTEKAVTKAARTHNKEHRTEATPGKSIKRISKSSKRSSKSSTNMKNSNENSKSSNRDTSAQNACGHQRSLGALTGVFSWNFGCAMGRSSIVKLFLTFWKVKSGKGGFFNGRPKRSSKSKTNKQQRKSISASRNKKITTNNNNRKSTNNKPHKQQHKRQKHCGRSSGLRLVFQRSAT